MKLSNLIPAGLVAILMLTAYPVRAATPSFDAAMGPVLKHYLIIQTALAADKTEGVVSAAKAIKAAAGKLDPKSVTGEHAAHYAKLPQAIAAAASELAETKDLASAREAFKKLSRPLAMWGTMSKPAGTYVMFCSMAKASWLQAGTEVRNPYYGSSMLTCGEIIGGAKTDAMPHGGEKPMDHSKMNH